MNPTVPVKPPGFLPLIFRMLEPLGRGGFVLLFALVGLANLGLTPVAAAEPATRSFDLVPSAGAAACPPDARGEVRLTALGLNQGMDVSVSGLPVHTTFTVLVLHLPHAPFGPS